MATQLFSSVECSQLLNIPLHKLAYAQRMGRIRKPSYIVAGKAIYTTSDLKRMAKYFGVEPKGEAKDEAKP